MSHILCSPAHLHMCFLTVNWCQLLSLGHSQIYLRVVGERSSVTDIKWYQKQHLLHQDVRLSIWILFTRFHSKRGLKNTLSELLRNFHWLSSLPFGPPKVSVPDCTLPWKSQELFGDGKCWKALGTGQTSKTRQRLTSMAWKVMSPSFSNFWHPPLPHPNSVMEFLAKTIIKTQP